MLKTSQETSIELPKILEQQLNIIDELERKIYGNLGRSTEVASRIYELLNNIINLRLRITEEESYTIELDNAIVQLSIALANMSTTIVADTQKKFILDEARRKLIDESLVAVGFQKR